MTDVHTPEQRSRNMAAIKGADTKPEMLVRRALYGLGYRYRLHRKDLPGKPDIVLPKLRTVIFVHGCFWHSHDCRWGRVVPKTRAEFWAEKRGGTVERDARKAQALEQMGWRVLNVWECETRDPGELGRVLRERLVEGNLTTDFVSTSDPGRVVKTADGEIQSELQSTQTGDACGGSDTALAEAPRR